MARGRPGSREGWRQSVLALALVAFVAPASSMHPRLERAEPAEDAAVALAPERLLLVFNEPVDAGLASLTISVDGAPAVSLPDVRAGDSSAELVAGVPSGLPAGRWIVRWRVVGPDGHPVTGEYGFAVAGARPAPVPPEPAAVPPPSVAVSQKDEPTLTVESPAWVAARWITYAAMLTVIGAVAFRFLVVQPTRVRMPAAADALDVAGTWTARAGRGAALFLALAAGVRVLLQAETLGGVDAGLLGILLFQTSWGRAWWVQLAGALLAAGALHMTLRGRSSAWAGAALAAVLIALGASLSSHAAASDLAAIAVTADALHILAVSGWLGTLLVLVGVGIPVVMAEDPRTGRFSTCAGMVAAFSPRALAMAAIAAATGGFAALLYLPSVSALWATVYGRTLVLKLMLVAAAAAIGAWNWRRLRPALDAGDSPDRLRRSATVELLVGALILLVTAVLVAVPTP